MIYHSIGLEYVAVSIGANSLNSPTILKKGDNSMHTNILEADVIASLDRSTLAFNEGRSEFFEEFAADATIYMADSAGPIKGREAYRELYQAALCRQGREKMVSERKVQIVGDKAVVTQKARITEAETSADVSQTMIYGQTSEGLKVVHSQTSLLDPRSKGHASSTVQVVKEVIAVSPNVVGVAQ
jgi:ketosteroid isomerase-like protein